MSEHHGIPDDFWRSTPCGHPPDPVAMYGDEGRPVCHCGVFLDPAATGDFPVPSEAPGPIIPCQNCGCYVAIPPKPATQPPAGGDLADRRLAAAFEQKWGEQRRRADDLAECLRGEIERLRSLSKGSYDLASRLESQAHNGDAAHMRGDLYREHADRLEALLSTQPVVDPQVEPNSAQALEEEAEMAREGCDEDDWKGQPVSVGGEDERFEKAVEAVAKARWEEAVDRHEPLHWDEVSETTREVNRVTVRKHLQAALSHLQAVPTGELRERGGGGE